MTHTEMLAELIDLVGGLEARNHRLKKKLNDMFNSSSMSIQEVDDCIISLRHTLRDSRKAYNIFIDVKDGIYDRSDR